MGGIRVAGHLSIDQSAPHDGGHSVDQGVLNTAVRDVNHAVGAELKKAYLRRPQPAAYGEPSTESKPGSFPRNHGDLGQTVDTRQFIECIARGRRNAALAEPRAAGTRRPVRARRQIAGHQDWDSFSSSTGLPWGVRR